MSLCGSGFAPSPAKAGEGWGGVSLGIAANRDNPSQPPLPSQGRGESSRLPPLLHCLRRLAGGCESSVFGLAKSSRLKPLLQEQGGRADQGLPNSCASAAQPTTSAPSPTLTLPVARKIVGLGKSESGRLELRCGGLRIKKK